MMGHSIKMALFDPQMRMGTLHARPVVAHRSANGLAKKGNLMRFKLSHVHSSKEGRKQWVCRNTFIEALNCGVQCGLSADRVINAVHSPSRELTRNHATRKLTGNIRVVTSRRP